jgi:AcrR family transcriptional regulator
MAKRDHFSYEVRLESLLTATSELLSEVGPNAVTLTAVAARATVSRQWLWEFFPDLDSLYAELFYRLRVEYLDMIVESPETSASLDQYFRAESWALVRMPTAAAMLGSYALNSHGSGSLTQSKLVASFYDYVNVRWIEPMMDAGFSRDDAWASTSLILNVAFGFSIGLETGATTAEVAQRRLARVIDSALPELVATRGESRSDRELVGAIVGSTQDNSSSEAELVYWLDH